MKHATAIAFLLPLLVLPAAAQVEIRGLTIAPPDRPGNGGIMLKSMISTRLPGEISGIVSAGSNQILVTLDGKPYRLFMRNGELVHEAQTPSSNPFVAMLRKSADLDGDGKPETVRFEKTATGSQMAILSQTGPLSLTEVAHIDGYGIKPYVEFADLTRSGRPQIVAVGNTDNCLDVIAFTEKTFKKIGSLSCGASLVADLVRTDIDGDGRYDLIAARQQGRIEIFLR